jgi:hypothetical protein
MSIGSPRSNASAGGGACQLPSARSREEAKSSAPLADVAGSAEPLRRIDQISTMRAQRDNGAAPLS